MSSYAFWNNKGGVGKSFLGFIAATDYAHRNPNADVYVIDLCPQANISETLLGGFDPDAKAMNQLVLGDVRCTIAGYLEERLSSPFRMIPDPEKFVSKPYDYNNKIPQNLFLVCGDNLLEILAEAIRQTSQLSVPVDAWKRVMNWVDDLMNSLRVRSGDRDAMFIVDCNPSFAIYTQLGLAACENVVVPFTADDSSRRAIENVIALLYGVGDAHTQSYARISFANRAKAEGVNQPKLHTFVSNRVTGYEQQQSKAFKVVSQRVKNTIDKIYSSHKSFFANPSVKPSASFIDVPDYHSACIVSATTGTPLHKLTAGPKKLDSERVQINVAPLSSYRQALEQFVARL